MNKILIGLLMTSLVIIISLVMVLIWYLYKKKQKDNYTQVIPRKLHQIYPTKKIPKRFLKIIKDLRNKNPEYIYKLYDDYDIVKYIKRYYGDNMLKIYELLNPKYGAARADFFRYLLLYNEGGVYLDIKSTAEKPFKEFIKPTDKYILSSWCKGKCGINGSYGGVTGKNNTPFGEYQQWHIIASPKHVFLKAVINHCIKNILSYEYTGKSDNVAKGGVLVLTGPVSYTNAIYPLSLKNPSLYRYTTNSINNNLRYTKLRTINEHEKFFKNHYSTITEPIVKDTKFKHNALQQINKFLL